jgi:hypothetical protein
MGDRKVVEECGYDRADGCNALMPRLLEGKADDAPKDEEDDEDRLLMLRRACR